jgi:hypothetical protein
MSAIDIVRMNNEAQDKPLVPIFQNAGDVAYMELRLYP